MLQKEKPNGPSGKDLRAVNFKSRQKWVIVKTYNLLTWSLFFFFFGLDFLHTKMYFIQKLLKLPIMSKGGNEEGTISMLMRSFLINSRDASIMPCEYCLGENIFWELIRRRRAVWCSGIRHSDRCFGVWLLCAGSELGLKSGLRCLYGDSGPWWMKTGM